MATCSREEHLQALPPAEPSSQHRGCDPASAALRGGLEMLCPRSLSVIPPAGSHKGSRSFLNTKVVSGRAELLS